MLWTLAGGVVLAISILEGRAEIGVTFDFLIAMGWFTGTDKLRRSLREQAQRERAEAEVWLLQKQATVASSQAQHGEHGHFKSIIHWTGRAHFFAECSRYILPRSELVLCLNSKLLGYYLGSTGLETMAINDEWDLIRAYPATMVIEATWEEHQVEKKDPFSVKPEFESKRGFYLFLRELPIWQSVAWSDEAVTLLDLFGKTVTLPTPSIEDVLRFVTTYNSVTDATLHAVAERAARAIRNHPNASLELQRARVALQLGDAALNGCYPLTDEVWNQLTERDPMRV